MHIPALKKQVLRYLDPRPNKNFVDCTIGGSGHSLAILEKNTPRGKILGIEIDLELYNALKQRCERLNLIQRLILANDSFVNLKKIVKKYEFKPIAGILFDLGMSTWHLEQSGRGFSFLRDEPLDMRYSITIFRRSSERSDGLTAAEIINTWPPQSIEKLLKDYGEERFAKTIVQEIVRVRKHKPITATFQLVEIIKEATPAWYHRKKIHPATKTFQALRIAVNNELENLKKALPQALEVLAPNGKLVVISFHSLEDRIVKNFFKQGQKQGQIEILTKKPIRPSQKEITLNPCSRSAKLRAARKTAEITLN